MSHALVARPGLALRLLALALLLSCAQPPAAHAESDDSARYGPNIDVTDPASRFLAPFLQAREPGRGSAVPGEPGVDVPLGGWNEVAIAVNPGNPLNIACATLFELRVTTDGGTTWKTPVPSKVPATYGVQGDPCLAFDADGRLFWSYLGAPFVTYGGFSGDDLFVAQCDPTTGVILANYPVNVTAQIGVPAIAGNTNDKEWLTADNHASSPFANRLYAVWTKFPTTGIEVTITSYSADHGLTWSAPLQLGSSTGFIWPTHIAVAPNGDVYAADHRQIGFVGGAPNGTSGYVSVFRSTNGGVSFGQQTQAFAAGGVDMTFNVQSLTGHIAGAKFWLQGSVQPWVLPDPNVAGRIYVVANDDPDNSVTTGDAADVVMTTSTDNGLSWGFPVRVDHGPPNTLQVMPTASIDPGSGAIAVQYYDTRAGAVNAQGDALLDVYATVSLDGGATFTPDFQVSDQPFDPDAGSRCRWDCGAPLSDVWAANNGKAFAVGLGGHFLVYDGAVWSIGFATAVSKYGIWGASDMDVFTCGVGGEILHYNGVTLTAQTSGTTRNLFGIDGRSGSDVYAVGSMGTVQHYDGVNWSALPPGTSSDLHDAWANPSGALFVVGDAGVVFRYTGAWTDLSTGTGETLEGVWGSSDTDVFVTSAQGRLYHWDGLTWSSIDTGTPLLGVWGRAPGDVIALSFGQIVRDNGGTLSNESVSELLLFRAHGSAPDNVFAVGEAAEIEHYDGTGWTRQSNPLSPTVPTLRIGEYNGVASADGGSFLVWCGNTTTGSGALDQQSIFDSFVSDWQTGVSLVDVLHRSRGLALEAPHPNPAGRAFTAAYSLPGASVVDLALVDVQGRRVATLAHGLRPAGRHIVTWDASRAPGVTAGVYLLRLTDRRETAVRTVSLLGTGGTR